MERCCNKSGHIQADALEPFHGSKVAIRGRHRPSEWAKRAQMGHFVSITRSGGSELSEQWGTRSQQVRAHTGDALEPFHRTEVAIGGAIGPLNGLKGPKCIQGHHGCLWLEYCIDSHFLGLFQPLWPPGTAIPGPKNGTSSSAWKCAIPFQLCSKLCHPLRVTTAAYGQNTAFMASFSSFGHLERPFQVQKR